MKLAFLGDWCLANNNTPPEIQHEQLTRSLSSSDYVFANFEGAIPKKSAKPHPKVGPHLAQDQDGIPFLREIGVTHGCLANNHAYDYGAESLLETASSLEHGGITPLGYYDQRRNIDQTTIRLEIAGTKVSIVNACEHEFIASTDGETGCLGIDPIALHQRLVAEKSKSAFVVMVLHGGIEHEQMPPPHLKRLAYWLIDNGAGAIITHHPHIPGFIDHYKGAPIAWSLGDFWMPPSTSKSKEWEHYGAAVSLNFVTPETPEVEMVPYKISRESTRILPITQEENDRMERNQRELASIFNNPSAYTSYQDRLIKKFSERYIVNYSASMLPVKPFLLRKAISKLMHASNPSRLARQLNGLRCESHRYLWQEALKGSIYDTKKPHQDQPQKT